MRTRIITIQYGANSISNYQQFVAQVDFILNSAAEYKPHYVLLPELFTTQLLSITETCANKDTIRKLDDYTERYISLLSSHAKKSDYYLIGGTHPTKRDGKLYNVSYLFTPSGEYFTQDKIQLTKVEKEDWKMSSGNEVKVFKTKYSKISILICYDSEFPELARIAAEGGAEIIFVPSYTDDKQGFMRVRYCCHARAIENQLYVAMASTVGTLPVENIAFHYGQSSILTPSDYPFANDCIIAEGAPNFAQLVIGDVDLELLDEFRIKGTTIPLKDERKNIYKKKAIIVNI